MARRRRRRRSQSSLSVGDSVRVGRDRQIANRLDLLPRVMPAGPVQVFRDRLDTLPLDTLPVNRSFRKRLSLRELQQRAKRARVSSRRSLLRLSVDERSRMCLRRGQRREVMFARRVAGRSWSGSGPKMRNARRNRDSRYTCRR